ncbi:AAA family ATPase, partial [archaeon]|nr:AAA family ATPase [archaeon]
MEKSLFANELALEPEFTPKIIKYRENQQKRIADCIKPLLFGRNGRNILVCGSSGIGKTLATKAVL